MSKLNGLRENAPRLPLAFDRRGSWPVRPTRRVALRAAIGLACLAVSAPCLGFAREPADEPGLEERVDEPGLELDDALGIAGAAPAPLAKHVLRFELGGGLSSLVVDPDVDAGYGGGFYLGYAYGRYGGELSVFLARNGYSGVLGEVGSAVLDAFIAGNITLGPTVRLTAAENPVDLTVDMGLGTYAIANAIQELVWTFGLSAGVSLGYRVTPWLGVGIKARYHLFNLARFGGGDDLIDRATFQRIGVIDRLEFPVYVGIYY